MTTIVECPRCGCERGDPWFIFSITDGDGAKREITCAACGHTFVVVQWFTTVYKVEEKA